MVKITNHGNKKDLLIKEDYGNLFYEKREIDIMR